MNSKKLRREFAGKTKGVLDELEHLVVDEGENLVKQDVAREYLHELKDPTNLQKYLNRRVTDNWFSALKSRIWRRHGLWFGCIGKKQDKDVDYELGVYGVVSSDAEARYAITGYHVLAKGVTRRAINLVSNVKEKNLLKGHVGNTMLALPKVKGDQ